MRGSRWAIIEAPSILGLFPSGVEQLPEALLEAGLSDRIGGRRAGRVDSPPFDPTRDPHTGLLNPEGLRDYAHALADAVDAALARDESPLVLGGDCSIVLGNLLALRRRGRYGLLFLDGHADFYQPEAEPKGEAASMDLALATGRGPRIVADLDGLRPLVLDEDVTVVGRRDADQAARAGSRRIEDTAIDVIDLPRFRRMGPPRAVEAALDRLERDELDGFWVHLDCDVLHDALMPAVDYRLPDGLTWQELQYILSSACASPAAIGLNVTIYNPELDPDRSVARRLAECLGSALTAT